MAQPRLLLIDDEPALADFLASAARASAGLEPAITSNDDEFREQFLARAPDMVALDLGMPGMDGVELLRFLAEQNYRGPVLIVSGFDRRVLESAFRLGEALGLNMAGPLEKPVRLEELEELLNGLKRLWKPCAGTTPRLLRGLRAGASRAAAAHGLSAQGLASRRRPDAGRGAGPLGRPRTRRRSRPRASCRWPKSMA